MRVNGFEARRVGCVAVSVAALLGASLAAPVKASINETSGWTRPAIVSPPDSEVGFEDVVIDREGNVTVAWGGRSIEGTEPSGNYGLIVRRKPTGGSWADEQVVDEQSSPRDMVVDTGGAVTILYGRGVAGHRWAEPYAITVDAAGVYGPPVALNAGERLADSGTRLVVAPDGAVTAVWVTRLAAGGRLVTAAHRPAGEPWQPATYLSRPGSRPLEGLDVSAGSNGDVTVVWSSRRIGEPPRPVHVRARTLHDGAWSGATRISRPVPRVGDDVVVASGSNGRALAAWLQRSGPSFTRPSTLAYTLRSADGTWARPRVIPDSAGPLAGLYIARAADRVVAVWTTWDTEVSEVFASVRQDGAWQRPVRLSGPNEQMSGLEVAGDSAGRFRVMWATEQVSRFADLWHIRTRQRSVAGRWSDTVQLTRHRTAVGGPELALGPARSAAAVWPRLGTAAGCCRVAYAETLDR